MNRKVQYTVPNMEQPCGQELELLRKTAHPDSWVRPLCSGASSLDPTLLGIFYFISFEVWLQTLFLLNFHLVAVVCGIIDVAAPKEPEPGGAAVGRAEGGLQV